VSEIRETMGFETYDSGGNDNHQEFKSSKDLSKEYDYAELWNSLFNSNDSVLPQKLSVEHRVVFVDADALVYRTSAACEKRSVVATIKGKEVSLSSKTKLKAYCKEVSVDFDSVRYEDVLVVEELSHCLATVKRIISNMKRDLRATHIIFLLGGSYNYRHDLPLISKYKDNRKGTEKPKNFAECKEYLIKYYDTFVVTGIEADDCVQGMTQHVINNTSAYGIAWQIDKDFHTSLTPNRYYHPVHKKIFDLDGGLGSLYLSGASVKGDGLMWVLFQLMLGDPSDGYSPKPFFNVRYGEKSYYKEFKDYKSEKELMRAWILKWKSLLPTKIEYESWDGKEQKHDWLSLAEIYFQCLYMRMSHEDETTFERLIDIYENKLPVYSTYGLCQNSKLVSNTVDEVQDDGTWGW
jgi:hypothetical protein